MRLDFIIRFVFYIYMEDCHPTRNKTLTIISWGINIEINKYFSKYKHGLRELAEGTIMNNLT